MKLTTYKVISKTERLFNWEIEVSELNLTPFKIEVKEKELFESIKVGQLYDLTLTKHNQ